MLQGVRLPMTDVITSPSSGLPGHFAGGTKYQEQEEVKPRKATAATWLVLLIFLPFFIEAFAYLRLLVGYIFVRNDAAYPEGANVYAFLTSFHTGMLYSAPLDFPLNVQPYGPLFYLVGAIMAKIAHGDPNAYNSAHAKRFFCVVSRLRGPHCLPVLEIGTIETLDVGCCNPRLRMHMGSPVCSESGLGCAGDFFDYRLADSLRGS